MASTGNIVADFGCGKTHNYTNLLLSGVCFMIWATSLWPEGNFLDARPTFTLSEHFRLLSGSELDLARARNGD